MDRIKYIDVCKGLLIIAVVMVHIPNYARSNFGLSQQLWLIDYILQFLFACFFMQSFFFLTGYTSNFNKNPKTFWISILKTIVIPKFSLCILWRIGDYIILGRHSLMTEIYGERYFFLYECYWFLDALFIVKIIQYYLCRYIKQDYIHALIWLVLLYMSIWINNLYVDYPEPGHHLNVFHYRNAMAMGFFTWLGYYFRKKSLSWSIVYYFSGLFIPIILFPYFTGFFEPVQYSHSTSITVMQIPKHLLFAISGTSFVLIISRLINCNKVLEYLGRNSLIIYCLHFPFLSYTMMPFNLFFDVTKEENALFFFIFELFSVLFLSFLSIEILNTKKLKWIIGKF